VVTCWINKAAIDFEDSRTALLQTLQSQAHTQVFPRELQLISDWLHLSLCPYNAGTRTNTVSQRNPAVYEVFLHQFFSYYGMRIFWAHYFNCQWSQVQCSFFSSVRQNLLCAFYFNTTLLIFVGTFCGKYMWQHLNQR
jgi:hypothetical protein